MTPEKKFVSSSIGNFGIVFEPRFEFETDAQYYGQVVRPELERQEVEQWERDLANSD